MFIQTEFTPNPNTMKFIPGVQVMSEGTAFYTSAAAAKHSPLAVELFKTQGVTAVFLGADFITVSCDGASDWETLRPLILPVIMDHFVAGKPVIVERAAAVAHEDESELVKQIRELIDTRVRPAVAQDGGDIVFVSFEDGIVQLELHGACSGCPSSTATLKNGIENMLKHYVPEVIAVEAVA